MSLGETNAVTVGIGDLEEGDAWEVMVRRESDNGLAVECQTEGFAVEQEVTASSPPSVTLLTSPGCPVGEYYLRGAVHRGHIGTAAPHARRRPPPPPEQ